MASPALTPGPATGHGRAMKPLKHLTERQKALCRELMKDPGAGVEKAALAAGYGKAYAHTQAFMLVRQPKIQAELARLRRHLEDDAILTAKQRMAILSEIASARATDFLDDQGEIRVSRLKSAKTSRAIGGLTFTDGEKSSSRAFRLRDAVAAIRELNLMDGSHKPTEHRVKFGPDDGLDGLTDAELAAIARGEDGPASD